jgi:hypothetical protein
MVVFENSLQTALDSPGLQLNPRCWAGAQPIVQATGDSEADVGPKDVMTCANASDGALSPTTSTARGKSSRH